jgi:hypothetical protein
MPGPPTINNNNNNNNNNSPPEGTVRDSAEFSINFVSSSSFLAVVVVYCLQLGD